MNLKNKELTNFKLDGNAIQNKVNYIKLQFEFIKDINNDDNNDNEFEFSSNKNIKYIIDLRDIILLSRIFIEEPKDIRIQVDISLNQEGPYINVYKNLACCLGNTKLLDFHFMPCRFVTLTLLSGKQLPKANQFECYGYDKDKVIKEYGESMLKTIYTNPIKLLYNVNI